MYPIPDQQAPLTSGGYVPYFYQRGLHLLYPLPAGNAPAEPQSREYAVYDFSRIDRLFGDADRTQTVEQIVERGYFAVPLGDPVTAILLDKEQTSRLGLDDLIVQVRQRYELYVQNFYQIQLAKCAAINAIYHHEAYRGAASTSSRQHYAKHKAIQDLYAQEREERVNLWRDVSRLKLLLPESARGYLAAHRKVQALNAPPGDAA
jgi:hypothetical protein